MLEIGWIISGVIVTIFLAAFIGVLIGNWRKSSSPYKAPPAERRNLDALRQSGSKPVKISPRLVARNSTLENVRIAERKKFSRTGKL